MPVKYSILIIAMFFIVTFVFNYFFDPSDTLASTVARSFGVFMGVGAIPLIAWYFLSDKAAPWIMFAWGLLLALVLVGSIAGRSLS